MPKPLCGSQQLWKILQEMGIPDHLICLLRKLYAGQKATVRTGHGTTDWFKIGKGVCQGYKLSPGLFNLYASQESRVRIGHGTTDWFKIGKGVCQGCISPLCLFNFCDKYIMQNAGLDEAQAGVKIARRNIKSLRYADNTTPMTERREELKNFLMNVKEESEKAGLKLNIQTKIMASGPITSGHIDGEQEK